MEFKEVESILKEIVVKIKDRIKLQELLHSMSTNFTTPTTQLIQAQITSHGAPYAAIEFFDSVKKKPRCFPKMVAAIKSIGQEEIYDIVINAIRKYFRNRPTRLAEVLSLICEAEREFGITDEHHDDIDGAANRSSSGNRISAAASPGYGASGNDPSKDKCTKVDRPVLQTPVKAKTPHSSSLSSSSSSSSVSSPPVSSPDNNNQPGATGYTGHVYENQPSSSPLQLNQRYAGSPILDLKADVYDQLGKALDKRVAEDDDEPWWRHMVLKGGLNISRKELKKIGKEKSPGIELLDLLDERGYTLGVLEKLFTRFRIEEALNILYEHQHTVKCTGERSMGDLCSNQNNLNSSQGTKIDHSKDMNIAAGVPTEEHDKPSELPKPSENIDSSSRDFSSSSLTTQDSSLPSYQSLEDNTRIIDDVFIKGTTAVQAHGDPTGQQSQPNPEQDALKLREDRVHQFDNNPDALEATSFITIGQKRTVDHDRDIGNMPLLSQLDSTEPSLHIGEPPVEANIEELPREQVNAVAPRSIGNEEIAEPADDAPYTTRVVSVDPSIRSTGSMEVPDNIANEGQNFTSDFQSENSSANSVSESNLLQHLNIDSGAQNVTTETTGDHVMFQLGEKTN